MGLGTGEVSFLVRSWVSHCRSSGPLHCSGELGMVERGEAFISAQNGDSGVKLALEVRKSKVASGWCLPQHKGSLGLHSLPWVSLRP